MGAGASSVNASTFLSADPDDEALLSVLCQDVTGAQRLLRQVERLMSLGGAYMALYVVFFDRHYVHPHPIGQFGET